jgi:hypothetical protein
MGNAGEWEMLTVHARLSTVAGKGVGRWFKMYEAEDEADARWRIRHLVPSAQVKVMRGREIVLGPGRADDIMRFGRDA